MKSNQLTKQFITKLSKEKHEPSWMLNLRLKGLETFLKSSFPSWGANLRDLDFNSLNYYEDPEIAEQRTWNDIPKKIKNTFEKLGIPQAERKALAGLKSQWDSNIIYGSLQKKLIKLGVIFSSFDEAIQKYPNLIKKYFTSIVSIDNNKFSALNTAFWSGGVFIYVPENIQVDLPLQAYFRINSPLSGQFERTLIILEKNAKLHYIEGCSAPVYSTNALHAGVVEILLNENASCQYSTIQNWHTNIYNLVTKVAKVKKNAKMHWVDGNIGSKITMKYPCCILEGEGAYGQLLSLALAKKGQEIDSGGKMIHLAPNTMSSILSRSISQNGGISTFRGLVVIDQKAENCRSKTVCNNLLLDNISQANTYPNSNIKNHNVIFEHEATVSRISAQQLNYLASRGFSEKQASDLILSGFANPIIKKFPLEYAVELNRLLEIEN